ncbi:MAG: gliding motility-associated C-terminal domain-containing protein [Bacteroidales bacterium]|nr:gliding motility-associated C-terminal domain-containing protein [Bacteroidales bacterium]
MSSKHILLIATSFIATLLPIATQSQNACPGITIDQRVDHKRSQFHINMEWDTAITCENPRMTLRSTVFVPTRLFNGTYKVEEIPYDPPEDFDLRSMLRGTPYDSATYNYPADGPVQRLDIATDDIFDWDSIKIDFPFAFFGEIRRGAVVGDNGMLTFNTGAAIGNTTDQRHGNAYSNINPLPWLMGKNEDGNDTCPTCPTSSFGGRTPRADYHHDAIYVCYCDTYPRSDDTTGIFKGVTDSAAYFPCRRIVVSWKNIDPYNVDLNNNYMAVCYEGTNIIEVHIHNFASANTSGYKALIGIQNKDGHPSQPDYSLVTIDGELTQPLANIAPNSPAAFAPEGYNLFGGHNGDTIYKRAFRFTPQGMSDPTFRYYRLFHLENGNDSLVPLTVWNQDQDDTPPNDTNGYYIHHQIINTDTLADAGMYRIEAVVEPHVTSYYVAEINFFGATGFHYQLYDTICVGVDTMNSYQVRTQSQNVCQNDSSVFDIIYDTIMQQITNVEWELIEKINGIDRQLPSSRFRTDNDRKHLVIYRPEIALDDHIDTVMLRSKVDFRNGCSNFDTTYTLMHPLYDHTTTDEICKSEAPYRWNVNGQVKTYYQSTQDMVKMRSRAGCDSIERLNLRILDTMWSPQYVDTCAPIVWRNGKLYSRNNDDTYRNDTIILHTQMGGCDSIVYLRLTIHPYEAIISVDPEVTTLDQLDVELTDVSTGTQSRVWLMPGGEEMTTPTVTYAMPVDADSAVFWLYAKSPYGCVDTASVMVPLQRETFWLPNILLPDDAAGNNIFRISTTQTNNLECFIYNRNGLLVGHFEGVNGSWDCRDLNGNPCPQGTYVYVIRYNTIFNPTQTQLRKGTITLIR